MGINSINSLAVIRPWPQIYIFQAIECVMYLKYE